MHPLHIPFWARVTFSTAQNVYFMFSSIFSRLFRTYVYVVYVAGVIKNENAEADGKKRYRPKYVVTHAVAVVVAVCSGSVSRT